MSSPAISAFHANPQACWRPATSPGAPPGTPPRGRASIRGHPIGRRARRAAAPGGSTIIARVMAGNEPTIATNTTARSATPNHTTASGTHATNGVIWSATTSGRMRARERVQGERDRGGPDDHGDGERERQPGQGLGGGLRERPVLEPREGGPHRGRRGQRGGSRRGRHQRPDREQPGDAGERGPSSLAAPHLAPPSSTSFISKSWISDTTRATSASSRSRGRGAWIRTSSSRRPGPADITSTRSASSTASRTLCVTNRNVVRPSGRPDALDLVLEELARLRVERAERFVAEQHVGLAARARASAARCRIPAESSCGCASAYRRGPTFASQRLARVALGRRRPPRASARARRCDHREPREQRGLLEQHRPVGARAATGVRRPAPRPRRLVEPRQHVEDRGLAAAAGTEQAHELARRTSNLTRRPR